MNSHPGNPDAMGFRGIATSATPSWLEPPASLRNDCTARLAAGGPPARTRLTQGHGGRRRLLSHPRNTRFAMLGYATLARDDEGACMTASDLTAETALRERIRREMADSLDEELELELDDHRLDASVDDAPDPAGRHTIDRTVYFKELFRLQGELVKLQDWVQHEKKKIVVAFRRARFRGQRRRDQAHHPAPQSARLPRRRIARPQRARADAMVFPALRGAPAGRRRNRAVRSQLVQPCRRRARDGLLHGRTVRGVFSARCRSSNAC